MKKKVVTCDICGRDITHASNKYKFNECKSGYINMVDFEFAKRKRLDMCDLCFFELLCFVSEKQKGKG